MKRELEREERLPAFNLEPGELELLWERMLMSFDTSNALSTSLIKLSLPSEKLEFNSFTELKKYGQVRGRVTNFSLHISQENRSLTVRSGGLFSSVPTAKAEGESEVWCAGATEAVRSVIRQNRVWYSWFIYAPINTLFLFLGLAPYVSSWLFPKMVTVPMPLVIAWLGVVIALGFLSITKDKILPAATLSFSNELGFIRRYGSELGLLLGVISLALTIISFL